MPERPNGKLLAYHLGSALRNLGSIKVALTLLARNEEDILEANLAYHFAAGVDLMIATDHRSTDRTSEILDRYAQAGLVKVIREDAEQMREAEWVTRMARIAAAEGADWVINSAADEFWWPRGGTLKEVLAAVPEPYGALRAFIRNFVSRPEDDRSFFERMTFRLSPEAPINDPTGMARPLPKVLHRASAQVEVARGSHTLMAGGLVVLPGWSPIEVLHFAFRNAGQLAPKVQAHLEAFFEPGSQVGLGKHARAFAAVGKGHTESHYAALTVDDEKVQQGIANGSIIVDTRLRDALRSLQADGSPSGFRPPEQLADALAFQRPPTPDIVRYAVEAACFDEGDLVRARRSADQLENRITAVETSSLVKRALRTARRAMPASN